MIEKGVAECGAMQYNAIRSNDDTNVPVLWVLASQSDRRQKHEVGGKWGVGVG